MIASRHRVRCGFVRDLEHRLGAAGGRCQREPRAISIERRETLAKPDQGGLVGALIRESVAAIANRQAKSIVMYDSVDHERFPGIVDMACTRAVEQRQ